MVRLSPWRRSLALAGVLSFLAASCSNDKGTKPPPPPPGDETPPAAILDLEAGSATHESISLTWTAPGDDDTLGTATCYSLRYAVTPLTEESWAAATEVVAVPPPDSAGSRETYRVTGLADRSVYFFGLKAADEIPNWSGLSNVITGTTPAGPAPDGDWTSLGTGTYTPVDAVEVFEGDLYMGGRFESAGDRPAFNIARWDGLTWSRLGEGTDRQVKCLAVYGGNLIAAGSFQRAGEIPARLIARWNGDEWDSLGTGLVASGHSIVLETTVHDGRLIVGGSLSLVDGYNLACWDGIAWSRFGTGAGTKIEALTVHNGEVIASGQFGAGIDHVVRWDGTAWIPLETGLWQGVSDLLTYEGDLIAVGTFNSIGGVEAHHIARWDGTAWYPLGAGLGGYTAYCLEIFDGDLIVGGDFPTAGGLQVRNVARWNGIRWYPMSSGMDGPVFDLTVWNGSLIAAGDFFEAGGVIVNHIARWDDQQ